MVQTTLLVGALAALAAAIPQQAEHISKAQLSRANQLFARADALELAARGISMDGSCGPQSGQTCSEGNCCSSLGWCGATPLHCGTGCQAGFGKCGTDSSAASAPAAAPAAPAASQPESEPEAKPEAKQETEPSPAPSPSPSTSSEPAPEPTQQAKAAQIVAAQGGDKAAAAIPSAGPSSGNPIHNDGPTSSQPQSDGYGNKYTQYSGDGSTSEGWPSQDSWVDFETSFSNNKAVMKVSCSQFGQADPSDSEIQDIHDSILSTASSSGVDSRFILAIVMQESKGCVRAPTTNWGVRNPGLMQSFNGKGTCNDAGSVQNPCPASEISQMITDGTAGTGPGANSLTYALDRAGGSDVSRFYKAARIYNSGSIAGSGLLQDGIATHCYSSDVANRLTGWTNAASACTFDGH